MIENTRRVPLLACPAVSSRTAESRHLGSTPVPSPPSPAPSQKTLQARRVANMTAQANGLGSVHEINEALKGRDS
jgi:hypothetical protein